LILNDFDKDYLATKQYTDENIRNLGDDLRKPLTLFVFKILGKLKNLEDYMFKYVTNFRSLFKIE